MVSTAAPAPVMPALPNPAPALQLPRPEQRPMVDQAARAHAAANPAGPAAPAAAPINPQRVAPIDPTAPITLADEKNEDFVDPAAPLEGGDVDEPVPADEDAQRAEKKKKAEEAQERKRDIIRKISMFVAPILLIIGISAVCFTAAVTITGFGWIPFSISLIVGISCLAGCGLVSYFGLIRIKKATPEEKPAAVPKPATKAT